MPLTAPDKECLGRPNREKALERAFPEIVFYSPSPMMSVPYLEMLHQPGLTIYYTSTMDLAWGVSGLIIAPACGDDEGVEGVMRQPRVSGVSTAAPPEPTTTALRADR